MLRWITDVIYLVILYAEHRRARCSHPTLGTPAFTLSPYFLLKGEDLNFHVNDRRKTTVTVSMSSGGKGGGKRKGEREVSRDSNNKKTESKLHIKMCNLANCCLIEMTWPREISVGMAVESRHFVSWSCGKKVFGCWNFIAVVSFGQAVKRIHSLRDVCCDYNAALLVSGKCPLMLLFWPNWIVISPISGIWTISRNNQQREIPWFWTALTQKRSQKEKKKALSVIIIHTMLRRKLNFGWTPLWMLISKTEAKSFQNFSAV